jgi:hypothetical protein
MLRFSKGSCQGDGKEPGIKKNVAVRISSKKGLDTRDRGRSNRNVKCVLRRYARCSIEQPTTKGCELRKCSNSKRPGSSEQCCPHEDFLDAWLVRAPQSRWQLHCCQSSHCWCGLNEDVPTRGRNHGNDRMHGGGHRQDGSAQAHRGAPVWTSVASRRCHRTFCSDGGAGRNRRAPGTRTPSILMWSHLPK